jgi:hypothetical protein
MPSPGPYTKAELKRRMSLVREGAWNDVVLVFENREIYTVAVQPVGGDSRLVRVVGTDLGTNQHVSEVFDPRDVTRVCH